jgi:hypothetical protein
MSRAIAAISGSAAALLPFDGLRNILSSFWHELSGDSYRPELHYMRGPGPAWHAKYGHKHGQLPSA